MVGQLPSLTAQDAQSDPLASSAGFTGTLQNAQLTLTFVGGATMTGRLVGQILRVPVADAPGQLHDQVWYAAGAGDYNALAKAFPLYLHLRAGQADMVF